MEETKLTAKEIFEDIKSLRKHMTEDDNASLRHLTNALAMLDGESEDGDETMAEAITAQVEQVCNVFKTRELNIMKLLEMYERMYNDIRKDTDK